MKPNPSKYKKIGRAELNGRLPNWTPNRKKWGMPRGQSPLDPERLLQRLLSLARINPESGCWEWMATISVGAVAKNNGIGGYGLIGTHGHMFTAHRLMYTITRGDPGDLCVCHKCDNRRCINPDHFFLGTHQENMADARRKGRLPTRTSPKPSGTTCYRPGEKRATRGFLRIRKWAKWDAKNRVVHLRVIQPGKINRTNVKLPQELIPSIRQRIAAGERVVALAKEFGVHRNTLYDLKVGRIWRSASQLDRAE